MLTVLLIAVTETPAPSTDCRRDSCPFTVLKLEMPLPSRFVMFMLVGILNVVLFQSWYGTITLALGTLRQEDHRFEVVRPL